jgi:hypothetical protein
MRTTFTGSVLAALVGLLALAPAAPAETALEQYQRTGRINICTASGGPGDIPNDVAQYAPDFLDAYNAAKNRGCKPAAAPAKPTETDEGVPVASNGQPLPPGAAFVPKPPAPPKSLGEAEAQVVPYQPLSVKGDTTTPAPIVALAIMLLLAAVGAALAATARYMGWGLDRLDPLQHAFGELRARSGDALSGLADRLRALVRRGA